MLYPRSCVRQCLCSTSVYSICLELKMHHKLAISYLFIFFRCGAKSWQLNFPEKISFFMLLLQSHYSLGTSVGAQQYGVFWHACLRNTLGHFWNKCRLTYTVTSPQTSQCGKGEKKLKNILGTQREYFQQHLYSTAWPIYDLAQRP